MFLCDSAAQMLYTLGDPLFVLSYQQNKKTKKNRLTVIDRITSGLENRLLAKARDISH